MRRRTVILPALAAGGAGHVRLRGRRSGRARGVGRPRQATSSPREKMPSALDDPRAPGLPEPLVDVDWLVSGGPPPDGIPAIDRPRLVRAGQVDWLADREPVLTLALGHSGAPTRHGS